MLTVSVVELFLKSAELLAAGCHSVELYEFEGDDEFPPHLSFNAIDDEFDGTVDYEYIEDHLDTKSFKLAFSPDSIAPYTMTFHDLITTAHAYHNAIENCKTCLDDKSLTADMRSEITSSMKKFEQYVQKLDVFLQQYIK